MKAVIVPLAVIVLFIIAGLAGCDNTGQYVIHDGRLCRVTQSQPTQFPNGGLGGALIMDCEVLP